MKLLRTPDRRFGGLADWPFAPHYADIVDAEGVKLRLAYVDEGPRGAKTVLLMHGEPSWSYLYRKIIPPLAAKGYRPLYVTARPDWLTSRTREFLAKNGFPPGIIHTTTKGTGAIGAAAERRFKSTEIQTDRIGRILAKEG